MKEQTSNRIKLGFFVLVATTFLILGLYYIGSKKNIFHSSIKVSATFSNVDGLMSGNNVHFNGINVGNVSKVYSISDTAIKVEFTIDEKAVQFISKDAIASLGTDGMLGNKLINVAPGKGSATPVEDGDVLSSVNPIQMDNIFRTLTGTNENLKIITDNLKGVSEKFNASTALWSLLTDTTLVDNVKAAVINFKLTGSNTAVITGDMTKFFKNVESGKGSIGALLTDTTFTSKVNQIIVNFESVSDSLAIISGNFQNLTNKLQNGEGSIGTLITDTTFVHSLNQSMENIKSGAGNFNENMEALKHSWPFKKYFKKIKKEIKKK
jgi:phospholipid/cholesterol/gamma-HCH transport system substrate-binding protein